MGTTRKFGTVKAYNLGRAFGFIGPTAVAKTCSCTSEMSRHRASTSFNWVTASIK